MKIAALLALLALAAIGGSVAAEQPQLPAGYSCADVRSAVEKYGKPKAARLAKRKGATAEQLAAAEKCL